LKQKHSPHESLRDDFTWDGIKNLCIFCFAPFFKVCRLKEYNSHVWFLFFKSAKAFTHFTELRRRCKSCFCALLQSLARDKLLVWYWYIPTIYSDGQEIHHAVNAQKLSSAPSYVAEFKQSVLGKGRSDPENAYPEVQHHKKVGRLVSMVRIW